MWQRYALSLVAAGRSERGAARAGGGRPTEPRTDGAAADGRQGPATRTCTSTQRRVSAE